MKFNHVGIRVNDLEKSILIYENLGYSLVQDICDDIIQNNRLAFLKNISTGEVIELIQPIDSNSTVINSKQGYHHICYEVKCIDEFIKEFKKKKIGVVFTRKIKAPAFNNRNIIFAYLKNDTIVEFLETGDVNE